MAKIGSKRLYSLYTYIRVVLLTCVICSSFISFAFLRIVARKVRNRVLFIKSFGLPYLGSLTISSLCGRPHVLGILLPKYKGFITWFCGWDLELQKFQFQTRFLVLYNCYWGRFLVEMNTVELAFERISRQAQRTSGRREWSLQTQSPRFLRECNISNTEK